MDILEYLNPETLNHNFPEHSLVHKHVSFLNSGTSFSSKLKYDIALIGVPDNDQEKTFKSATEIRNELYKLVSFTGSINILDLGNIKTGHTFKDTCFAIREVTSFVNELGLIIIPMGGASFYNLGNFLAFEKTKMPVNMAIMDSVINKQSIPILSALDFGLISNNDDFSSNYINIGYQSYYVDKKIIDYLNDSYYEAYRVGYVRSNMKDMEPVLRDVNLLSFSLNSVKYSDAPGAINSSPNGFTGEEACQLAFYAGHSNRIKCFGLFDHCVEKDNHSITARLGAQIIWYFIEAHSNSIFEEPDLTPENFKKFLIHLNHSNQDISFYKSNLTNRWWMEINYPDKNRNLLLSCSEADYELACQQEIPDRWLRTFHRITH